MSNMNRLLWFIWINVVISIRGVPQGDALLSRLFNRYLHEALREFADLRFNREPKQIALHEHYYAVNEPPTLPSYLVYADDLDFICEKDENPETIVEKVNKVLAK